MMDMERIKKNEMSSDMFNKFPLDLNQTICC
jgi:hypothetical protein